MIGFHEAVAAVAARTAPAGEEEVPLTAAAGRVLAGPLAARLDLPRFDATAMDGWAIRRKGSFPARLRVLGTLAAGRVSNAGVGPGEALKIMTGAPIPPGADAVVPVEEAREEAGIVIVETAPRALAHVRRRGEIFAAGANVLEGGCVLTPARLAVAASAGHATLRVVRRSRAGLLVTGEEIAPAGTEPGPGKIPNSNGPLLHAALTRAGAHVTDLGVSRDDEAELSARLQAGVAAGLDLLVTTGGVSAGDFDLVAAALNSLGAEIVFHKVAIRPAKPVLFARLGATLVFGLPGNPVSAAVGFDFFVRAALRTMAGLPPLPAPFAAALLAPVRNAGGRLALLPGRLHFAGGIVAVEPVTTRGSHDILAQAGADAIFLVPNGTSLRAGESVLVYPAGTDTTL
ncbi:MAG TPA: gephyrin-like molybdotransferase Glp [Thermoanaerobaculia bacterium]